MDLLCGYNSSDEDESSESSDTEKSDLLSKSPGKILVLQRLRRLKIELN